MIKKDNNDFTSIQIPTALAEKIKKRISGTEFHSVSAYIAYVLGEVMSDNEGESEEEFTKDEEKKIKDRLRSLGYLE